MNSPTESSSFSSTPSTALALLSTSFRSFLPLEGGRFSYLSLLTKAGHIPFLSIVTSSGEFAMLFVLSTLLFAHLLSGVQGLPVVPRAAPETFVLPKPVEGPGTCHSAPLKPLPTLRLRSYIRRHCYESGHRRPDSELGCSRYLFRRLELPRWGFSIQPSPSGSQAL